MILQRIRIIVGDAGFEPGPMPQKSDALQMSQNIDLSRFSLLTMHTDIIFGVDTVLWNVDGSV